MELTTVRCQHLHSLRTVAGSLRRVQIVCKRMAFCIWGSAIDPNELYGRPYDCEILRSTGLD